MTDKKNNDIEEDKLNGLFKLLIGIFLVWIISIFVIPFIYTELTDRASFGDSFGLINSLFSGFAFAGIIYTILLQRKELSLQRKELQETRMELNRSATAQEKSETQQRRQSENLKITAKLNALSTLVSYYSDVETKNKTVNSSKHLGAQREQETYIRRIKDILNTKEHN
jgi:ferric iron reductase protein FhuF